MKRIGRRVVVLGLSFALSTAGGCGDEEGVDRQPPPLPPSAAWHDPTKWRDSTPIVYQAPFGFRSFLFDTNVTRMETHLGGTNDAWSGGDMNIPLVDCSDADLVCRSVPGGPVLFAISRDLEHTDSWSSGGYQFSVTRRGAGSAPGAQMIFVETTTIRDPTWREAFVYDTGRGVIAITVNYDDSSRLAETLLLVGRMGILSDLQLREPRSPEKE